MFLEKGDVVYCPEKLIGIVESYKECGTRAWYVTFQVVVRYWQGTYFLLKEEDFFIYEDEYDLVDIDDFFEYVGKIEERL